MTEIFQMKYSTVAQRQGSSKIRINSHIQASPDLVHSCLCCCSPAWVILGRGGVYTMQTLTGKFWLFSIRWLTNYEIIVSSNSKNFISFFWTHAWSRHDGGERPGQIVNLFWMKLSQIKLSLRLSPHHQNCQFLNWWRFSREIFTVRILSSLLHPVEHLGFLTASKPASLRSHYGDQQTKSWKQHNHCHFLSF